MALLTGVKPPPQKKAKLSETDARYEKEKRKREPQKTWKDKRVVHLNVWDFLPGNQIHGFGCPAFEIGTTWIFF